MKAEGTVMSGEGLIKADNLPDDLLHSLTHEQIQQVGYFLFSQLVKQRDISLKAGEQLGIVKGSILGVKDLSLLSKEEIAELNIRAENYLEAVKQEGIKGAVEWLRDNNLLCAEHWRDRQGNCLPNCPICMLEAKLKEWEGLRNESNSL